MIVRCANCDATLESERVANDGSCGHCGFFSGHIPEESPLPATPVDLAVQSLTRVANALEVWQSYVTTHKTLGAIEAVRGEIEDAITALAPHMQHMRRLVAAAPQVQRAELGLE